MTQWFYAKDGERLGPVDEAQLRALWDGGELSGDSLVWREGMLEWQALHLVADQLPGTDHVLTAQEDFASGDAAAATSVAEPASPYAAPSTVATGSPRIYQGDVVLAGFLKRYAAASIDGFVLAIVTYLILGAGMLIVGVSGAFNPQSMMEDWMKGTLGIALIFGMYGVIFGVQATYFTWMHASSSQATLGKMAVGIKVTRGNGQTLSGWRSFGRWAAYALLGAITCNLTLLISAFTSGLTARKQGLHDMMVDSLVVDKWAFTAHPERQRRELGVVTWVVIVLSLLLVLGYFALIFFMVGMGAMSR